MGTRPDGYLTVEEARVGVDALADAMRIEMEAKHRARAEVRELAKYAQTLADAAGFPLPVPMPGDEEIL
jgi:hypothetical protein